MPDMYCYWEQSAINNPTIDFLIITDDKNIQGQNNIKVIYITFKECVERFQSLFDFKISLEKPYKLCDFKPVYGEAFADYCKGYDFWGFGDLDLVLGDIRHFITDDILSTYWIISGWGHLTLYRNIPECTKFYKNYEEGYPYYKNVFSSPKAFVFDEYLHGGMSDRWKKLRPDKLWDSQLFDDIVVPYLHFEFVSFNRPHCRFLIFEYNNGKLYRIFLNDDTVIREETLYAHFQQRKFMRCEAKDLNHYIIIPNKFIEYRDFDEKNIIIWGKPQKFHRLLYSLYRKMKRRMKKIREMQVIHL